MNQSHGQAQRHAFSLLLLYLYSICLGPDDLLRLQVVPSTCIVGTPWVPPGRVEFLFQAIPGL